jgi:hypothetical protein
VTTVGERCLSCIVEQACVDHVRALKEGDLPRAAAVENSLRRQTPSRRARAAASMLVSIRCEREGDIEGAIAACREIVRLGSLAGRVTAVLHMARLLVRQGRPDEARAALRDALDGSTKPRARALVLVLGMLADLGLEDRTTWWEAWDACARARRVASRDRLIAAGDPTAAMVALKAAPR